MAIAQIRYEGDGTWTLYFGDRNGKWTVYFDLDSHQPIDVILDEIACRPHRRLLGLTQLTRATHRHRRAYHHVRPRIPSPPLGGTSSWSHSN